MMKENMNLLSDINRLGVFPDLILNDRSGSIDPVERTITNEEGNKLLLISKNKYFGDKEVHVENKMWKFIYHPDSSYSMIESDGVRSQEIVVYEGKLHNRLGFALVNYDGYGNPKEKYRCINGMVTDIDGEPGKITYRNKDIYEVIHFQSNLRHKDDGPAYFRFENKECKCTKWYKNGLLDRDDEPAIEELHKDSIVSETYITEGKIRVSDDLSKPAVVWKRLNLVWMEEYYKSDGSHVLKMVQDGDKLVTMPAPKLDINELYPDG